MIKKYFAPMPPTQQNTRRHPIFLPIHNHAAEKVLNQLHHAGYEAYLVGGAVRDLLLGLSPKDFDIATNATPEQVKKLFNHSRIIGRRFQIVHVIIGKETIEVSTFRSGEKNQINAQGRIMRDNTYGTLEQDAQRRDFTCNALYYDNRHHEIIDYHNGLEDIQNKKLVMIGQPDERYVEDPVRILRAIRLAGKLQFSICPHTAMPIHQHAHLLAKEPSSRLFDELLKILFSGHAISCLAQLKKQGINKHIHPLLNILINTTEQTPDHIGVLTLQQTDERIRQNKSVSVGFILAALFWDKLNQYWQQSQQEGKKPSLAMTEAVFKMRTFIEHNLSIPQRYLATMSEIWLMQTQFDNQKGARPFRLIAQARFHAAYDFLLLRAYQDPQIQQGATWWAQFQHANNIQRQNMAQYFNQPSTNTKKKKHKSHKNKLQTPLSES